LVSNESYPGGRCPTRARLELAASCVLATLVPPSARTVAPDATGRGRVRRDAPRAPRHRPRRAELPHTGAASGVQRAIHRAAPERARELGRRRVPRHRPAGLPGPRPELCRVLPAV